tara:strand:+ start:317 stop:508 length:192 start_codon:yes stop_codon:yes gene_type:complete
MPRWVQRVEMDRLTGERSGMSALSEVCLEQREEEVNFGVLRSFDHGFPVQLSGFNDSAESMFL